MELAREKGGSSTLTTIPISEHGFCFDVKSDFHDHVHLRYCWPLDNLPPTCPCGANFTIDHAQICKLSGFIHMRHNDPTTFLAQCMKEVHQDVELEPPLQPLNGETFRHLTANTEPDARADIRVRDFWTNSRNAFFDTRVFYPHARSYQSRSLPSLYKRFESEKKREYGERINTVEHGSFTPLVFSACGGMGHEATVAVRKLASALASKRRETYSRVINWLRCRLSFSLARSAIRLSDVCAAVGLSDARVHPAWHQWTWSAPRPTSTCINSKSLYIICCITMHHNCVFQNTKDTPTIT